MPFNTKLAVRISPPLGAQEQFLAVRPPSSLAGVPLDKQIKGFVLEFYETCVDEYKKIPGMEEFKADPKWARDYKLVQRMLASCGNIQKLNQLAQLFWQDEKFKSLPKTLPMMHGCWDSLLERVAQITKEGMD